MDPDRDRIRLGRNLYSTNAAVACNKISCHQPLNVELELQLLSLVIVGTCESFFLRSNRISNRIGRPIRFRI